MPEREFELYLGLLGKLLKLTPEQKSAISDELRDHLEERFEELVQAGQSRDEAIRQALDEFGDAAGLAIDFTQVSRKTIRRTIVRTTAVTTAVTALAAFLFVCFGPGQGGNEGPGGSAAIADSGEQKPAVGSVEFLADDELFPKVLEQPTPASLVDTPLVDALMYFSQLHEIPILLDATALEEYGIPGDTPITLDTQSLPRAFFEATAKAAVEKKPAPDLPSNADQVSLRLALDWICRPLDLAWYLDDGVIHVTTIDEDAERLVPRSYDVGGLLKSGLEPEMLVKLVLSLDAEWQQLHGNGGTEAIIGNILTVRQTWKVHRNVAELLATLAARRSPYQYLTDHNRHVRLLNLLQREVTAEFIDTPLSETLKYFADSLETRIHIDEVALNDNGISLDEPINLVLKGVSMAKAVSVALDPLRLKLVVIDGRLTLTTQDVADENLHAVLYDISDVFAGEEVEAFVAAFQETTTGMWEVVDGAGGRALALPESGRILVQQTDVVHAQIRDMIAWSRSTLGEGDEARKARAEAAAQSARKLITRFYRMDRDSADDLLTLLPEVIDPESWKTDDNARGGFIRKVAAGRRILEVKGHALSGQAQLGGFVTPPRTRESQPAKKATELSPPELKTSVVIPEAILVIRQTQNVHRKIETFLNDLGIEWQSTAKLSGGGPSSGGGYF